MAHAAELGIAHRARLRLINTLADGRELAAGLLRTRNRRELNYYVCRFFYGRTRDWLADRIADYLPRPEQAAPKDDPRVVELAKQGYTMLPNLVSPAVAESLRRALGPIPCGDPYRSELGSFSNDKIPAITHVAFLDTAALVKVQEIWRIVNHPAVLSIVERMLGAKPTAWVTAWWSNPSGAGAEHAERFHRDKDDWRFFKLFLYLTDVDEEAGPHAYVPGSHLFEGPQFRRQIRYEDEEIRRVFGENSVHFFTGPPGTAFLENTYGLHRGIPPRSKRRLIFQVTYSLIPLMYAPVKPQVTAADIGLNVDPWINRYHIRS